MTEHATTESPRNKPAFIAHDVQPWGTDPAEPESVGVAFAHRDGNGYDLLLDGLPLSGKIVCRRPGSDTTGVSSLLGGLPAKRPDYVAYVVPERKGKDGKSFWRRVGYGYRHEDGEGLDIVYKVMPVNGRISLRLNDK